MRRSCLLILGLMACQPATAPSQAPVIRGTSVNDGPAGPMGQPAERPSVVHDGPLLPAREAKLPIVVFSIAGENAVTRVLSGKGSSTIVDG